MSVLPVHAGSRLLRRDATVKSTRSRDAMARQRSDDVSDMIGSIRRYLWMELVFTQIPGGDAVQKLPKATRAVLDIGLALAV